MSSDPLHSSASPCASPAVRKKRHSAPASGQGRPMGMPLAIYTTPGVRSQTPAPRTGPQLQLQCGVAIDVVLLDLKKDGGFPSQACGILLQSYGTEIHCTCQGTARHGQAHNAAFSARARITGPRPFQDVDVASSISLLAVELAPLSCGY